MAHRVGFVGLGNQGKPIALHLAPAGFETTVFDLAEAPVRELVASGARAAGSPREVAEHSDVVGVCVPDDADVRGVVLGDEGLLAGAAPGLVIAIHSTILPETAVALGAEATARGVAVLDACVTGGAARAAQKTLTYLVGGDAAVLDRVRPFLECSSERIIYAGPLGFGAKLKLCINLLTYLQWAAAYESFQLARAIGLPQERLEEAGRANGQLTPLMLAYLALHKAPEESRRSATTQSVLRGYQRIADKDLAQALQLAAEADLELPVGALVSRLTAQLYGVADDEGPK